MGVGVGVGVGVGSRVSLFCRTGGRRSSCRIILVTPWLPWWHPACVLLMRLASGCSLRMCSWVGGWSRRFDASAANKLWNGFPDDWGGGQPGDGKAYTQTTLISEIRITPFNEPGGVTMGGGGVGPACRPLRRDAAPSQRARAWARALCVATALAARAGMQWWSLCPYPMAVCACAWITPLSPPPPRRHVPSHV